ncbi:MAG: type II toxin-antitoxin system RelE/ParE family toxin [Spirochaetes bacterium]|nr:MAG: type II toxin-antitoxin system RelE/ParE family toxin [Spirochaetota bacterium]
MRHSAQKILSKINRQEQERIIAAINSLTNTPRPSGCKKLSGRPAWRIRIGFYRVIYEIQDNKLIVTVVHIGHRREVYR